MIDDFAPNQFVEHSLNKPSRMNRHKNIKRETKSSTEGEDESVSVWQFGIL